MGADRHRIRGRSVDDEAVPGETTPIAQTVVLSVNTAWNILNFRMGIVRALQERGLRVYVIAAPDEAVAELEAHGITVLPLAMHAHGINPFREIGLYTSYLKALARVPRPVLAYLGFTIKPNIWGALAARRRGIPVVNNIAGLGAVFARSGPLTWIALPLYRLALRGDSQVFFQNTDDRDYFLARRVVRAEQSAVVPGSGVDLRRFSVDSPPRAPGDPHPPGKRRFLLVARLLWDKGIGEYVAAARSLRASWPECEFHLVGFATSASRAVIPDRTVQEWHREGSIIFHGRASDVRPHIAAADCVVLPTAYREGTPRILLEAAAMQRPVVTTDIPGARDAVIDGVTGYLCRPRNASDLADTLDRIIRLAPEAIRDMGHAARRHIEAHYDERIVIEAYMRALDRLS